MATVDVDEESRPPTVSTRPIESYGKYDNQRVKNIFKEWKNAGPKADMADEHIEFIINFEFAESERPSKRRLIDSVLREPSLKPVLKDRFDPVTGKKIPGEQNKWMFDPSTGANFSDKGLHFEQGQFVEFLGRDMQWHLSTVRRIVKLAPEDWEPENEDDEPDYEYFYNIGAESLIPPRSVRAPEEGLKLVYGFRPWIWQQWACLQLESTARFLPDHDKDFQAMSFRKNASDLWDWWYNHQKNSEFKEHTEKVEEEYPGSRDKLLFHILSPFSLMDDLAKKPEWDLVGDANVYLYLSYLGSGFVTALVCLAIQFTVPIVLIQAAVGSSPRFDGGWEEFCSDKGSRSGLIMNITVLCLYAIRVLPNLLFELFSSSGMSDEPVDKVNALRKILWDQGDDTVSMQVGFKVNKYANGFYVTLLMSIMLFILFLTDDIFEIILNALALEFVHSLDEELVEGDWYDPDGRWIRAGAVELVLRIVLRLDKLMDWKKFCAEFDISEAEYTEAFGGKPLSLKSYYQGRKDAHDKKYMSQKDRYYVTAAAMARKMKNKDAVWNFQEETVAVGFFDMLLQGLGLLDTGVFSRYKSYSVWSRWNKILFLATVPQKNAGAWYGDCMSLASNHEGVAIADEQGTRNTSKSNMAVQAAAKSAMNVVDAFKKKADMLQGKNSEFTYLNFNSDAELSPLMRFREQSLDILFFEGVAKSIGIAVSRGEYLVVPFRFVDGMVDYVAYLYQLCFPFVLVFFMVILVLCY